MADLAVLSQWDFIPWIPRKILDAKLTNNYSRYSTVNVLSLESFGNAQLDTHH